MRSCVEHALSFTQSCVTMMNLLSILLFSCVVYLIELYTSDSLFEPILIRENFKQRLSKFKKSIKFMPRDKALCDVLDAQFYSTSYRDRRNMSSDRELNRSLRHSATLYIGNLSFYTREEQVWELFSRAGEVRRVIMGLHRYDKTPCGFCFVEYVTREGAEMAMRYINRTRLDDRVIRTDWDAGFEEGRQYGRGRSGGQVRDEYRKDYDADRGGYGNLACAN